MVINERNTSSIWKMLYLLIEQPVIYSKYLKNKLGITLRSVNKLINRSINYGILRRVGSEKRGIFYQADEIIDVMDKIASTDKIHLVM